MSDIASLVLLANAVAPSSVLFRFERPCKVVDWSGEAVALRVVDGVTEMSADDGRKRKKERFAEKVVAPGASAELNEMTERLKKATEQAGDVKIGEFRVTWGVKEGKLPAMIRCEGDFVCNEGQFAQGIRMILLFVARELAQVVEPGKCVTRRAACRQAVMTACRESVEIYRIKKMNEALRFDCRELVKYVVNRMESLRPGMMKERVPVCKTCFSMYDRVTVPGIGGDPMGSLVRLPRVEEPRDRRLRSGLRLFHSFATDSMKRARATYSCRMPKRHLY